MSTTTGEPPVRVGVIGVGRIGRLHAELLSRQITGAEVTAVFDVFGDAATTMARELGVVRASSAEELISAADVDAVAICSSTDTHADLLVAAAAAGKAIFCEKPVSLDLSEVDRALSAVASAGVPFQIGFNRRFDPGHASVAEAVRAGRIGEPHLARISSRDPAPPPLEYVKRSGGLFLDMTIHDFDMARFVTGSEVVEVFARGAVRIDPAVGEAGDIDTALVTLVHENGCLTSIDNSRQAKYGYDQRVEVFGSEGMATSENPPAHAGSVRTAEGLSGPPLPYFFLDRYVPSYVREWEAFIASVRDGTPSAVGVTDARAPLVIGLAAWQSVREGRPVAVETARALA
jgi:myo-inositol 2-dehydrogenase/D-chiro-inositol 1-dehydrogenase